MPIFSPDSTSYHTISADGKLSYLNLQMFYFFNSINNFVAKINVDKRLRLSKFRPPASFIKQKWPLFFPTDSPARRWCDLFWISLPWSSIINSVGPLNIFDFGCGKGVYFQKLTAYSQQKISHYTGIDIQEYSEWIDQLHSHHNKCRFIRYDGESIAEYIPKNSNFIITQSSLEHMSNDLQLMKEIRDFTYRSKRGIIQIHLLPSEACLKLYQDHGIRQYNLRTLSSFTRLYSHNAQITLFALGGAFSNKVHFNFITQPLANKKNDKRLTLTNLYKESLLKAILQDNETKGIFEPSFYGLIIHTYPDKPVKFNYITI